MTHAPALPDRCLAAYPAHLHSGRSPQTVSRALLLATVPVVIAALILHGRTAAAVFSFAVLGGLAGEWAVCSVAAPGGRRDLTYAVLLGVLVGCTLPVTVRWHFALLGGLLAVTVGNGILGGAGNRLWHPALVGWAGLQILCGPQLAPRTWPVLAYDHVGSGSVQASAEAVFYRGYTWSDPPGGVEAWALPRPLDLLIGCYDTPLQGRGGGLAAAGWLGLFRDRLPPWRDTVWGAVGGGLGETCTVALLIGGLYLIYGGWLRWPSVAAALLTVALLAALLPIRVDGQLTWFPLAVVAEGFPAGVGWLLFHLTGGGLLLTALLLAADPGTTPLTARGHALFGVGLGALTMAARWAGLSTGDSYWALLAMNTLVPLLDRWTRRRTPCA
jgi:Na+-translocating ferredoxin:NAD+ oxidoreductase subunit D